MHPPSHREKEKENWKTIEASQHFKEDLCEDFSLLNYNDKKTEMKI